MRRLRVIVVLYCGLAGGGLPAGCLLGAETDPRADALSADAWRRERRIVDMHMHVEGRPERFDQAARIMDAVGIGTAVDLGSGVVTAGADGPSPFERVQQASRGGAPGRFVHYMILDYRGFDDDGWSERAAAQIELGRRLGAVGLKEFKRLGLGLRDAEGRLIRVDDRKLDGVWRRCGELGMPVSIHVGDPQAFWEPLNETNERWNELRDHPEWWFGDAAKYPPRMELLDGLARVIARHPETTFVGVHFGNNPEDLDWVDQQLDQHPNMMIDLAARIPEIGRRDPERLREFFIKHQDRILFGTDFQAWSRLILGSAGDDERPTEQDAIVFFERCYRFLETDDRDWPHMTPIQGDWTISSIDLPAAVQRKVYFDNAARLLARSLPPPALRVKRIAADFKPDGKLDESAWDEAPPARVEYGLADGAPHVELSTCARALWSDKYLYLAFEAPYTELTTGPTSDDDDRLGLWDEDVVELFVGAEADRPQRYAEFEWAPNGETLDVLLDLPEKDFAWDGGGESAVSIDRKAKIWRVEARIPLTSLSDAAPTVGTRWRGNLYRNDAANKVFLAWRPTLTVTAHEPERFGWVEFVE